MWVYRHTQSGALIRWALGLGAALTLVVLIPLVRSGTAGALVPASVLVVLVLFVWLFGALTVEVSSERVALWFGPGVIRKQFTAASIRGVAVVLNRWYWGWGIRLTPHGWLYNVSGLEAVELSLEGGKTVRIGTDEPQKLEAAIRQVTSAVD